MTTIAVIGTSNAVMRDGYVKGLCESGMFDEVLNFSVGSSTSVLLPYSVENLIKSGNTNVKAAVLDFCVNEQLALFRNAYKWDMHKDLLDYFLCFCSRKAILPFVLIMPEKIFRRNEEYCKDFRGEIRQKYMKYCYDNGVHFFDGYTFADQLKASAEAHGPLFKDRSHLASWAAKELGESLADFVIQALANKPTSRFMSAYNYYSVRASDFVSDSICINRSSSIFSGSFIQLNEGASIRVPVPDRAKIVGICINMARTSGFMSISGKSLTIKDLRNSHFEIGKKLWFAIWSVINEVEEQDGFIRIACEKSVPDKISESNDHFSNSIASPFSIELHGFILKGEENCYEVPFHAQKACC